MENIKCNCFFVNKSNLKEESIIKELRRKGYRITNQRKLIIDTIINKECSSCKEIYWEVMQKDSSIGIATVYRIINSLESIGIIDRKNLYKIPCDELEVLKGHATLIFKDNNRIDISKEMWGDAVKLGLSQLMEIPIKDIESIIVKNYEGLKEEK